MDYKVPQSFKELFAAMRRPVDEVMIFGKDSGADSWFIMDDEISDDMLIIFYCFIQTQIKLAEMGDDSVPDKHKRAIDSSLAMIDYMARGKQPPEPTCEHKTIQDIFDKINNNNNK